MAWLLSVAGVELRGGEWPGIYFDILMVGGGASAIFKDLVDIYEYIRRKKGRTHNLIIDQ